MPPPYRSPARSRHLGRWEEAFLAAEPSPRRRPFYVRVRARAPRVLYLNYLARRDFAAALAPDCFQPLRVEPIPDNTLFSILIFELEGARPVWAPAWWGRLAPRFVQANWRFYGRLSFLPEGERPGVLFWRTVTDSLFLAVFGRRLARCFPLHRARRLELIRRGDEIMARADPAGGSAPGLSFLGRLCRGGEVPTLFRSQFAGFADYARWIMDQHLSATVWEREVVIQDMHLALETAGLLAVEPVGVNIPALAEFVENPAQPLSCFLAENVEVWLDSIRALPRRLQTAGRTPG